MIIYSKITKTLCLVDEFCKEYDELVDKHLLDDPSKRPSIMSQSEVITIAILFQLSGFRTFKHFYIYYLQKHMQDDLMQLLFTDGLHLIRHIKNNMKNSLMTMSDKILLRKRSIIETVNDELKSICQIEHSRHRSFTNFLSNIVTELIAYSFLPKKTYY